METANLKRSNPHKWRKFFLRLSIAVTTIALSQLLVFQIAPYHGINMYPAVRDGDLLVIYRQAKCQIGDAVCYEDPEGNLRIGRIAATEGQTVDLEESGEWTLNGAVPYEPDFSPTMKASDSTLSYPYSVEENSYFIMNDYRTETNDSRMFGSVTRKQIRGKVVFILRVRGI